jgi:hypothetical protein
VFGESPKHPPYERAQLYQHFYLCAIEAREPYRPVILRQFIIMFADFHEGLVHVEDYGPLECQSLREEFGPLLKRQVFQVLVRLVKRLRLA